MIKSIFTLVVLFLTLPLQAQWNSNGTNLTTSDNVGIGETSPSSKLHIKGPDLWLKLQDSNATSFATTNAGIQFNNHYATVGQIFQTGEDLVMESRGGVSNLLFKTQTVERLRINKDGNVGIGTINPNLKLHIKDPIGGAALGIERGGKLWRFDIQNTGNKIWFGNTDASSLFEFDNNGAFTVSTQFSNLEKASIVVEGKKEGESGYVSGSLISGNADNAKFNLFNVGLESWYGIGFRSSFNNKVGIIFNTRTASAFFEGNVGIGTDNPDAKLTVAGNIHSREVKVTINAGADFVFANDYELPSLEYIETFVKKNKHLPEIPSEKEMKENGLLLAKINIKLLQKIEELTLYTFQQQKEINEQKDKAEKQSKEIESLEDKFEVLQIEIERLKKKN